MLNTEVSASSNEQLVSIVLSCIAWFTAASAAISLARSTALCNTDACLVLAAAENVEKLCESGKIEHAVAAEKKQEQTKAKSDP
jgi:hypothetical protein